jgi:hypothetical protein
LLKDGCDGFGGPKGKNILLYAENFLSKVNGLLMMQLIKW